MKLALAALAFISCCIASGQQVPAQGSLVRRVLPAEAAKTPPVIDGDISESAWQSASKAEVFVDRQSGNPVADQTIAYVLYDAKYIYIAFHCLDRQPDLIEARETQRDSKYANQTQNPNNEDNVTVSLDTYFTKDSADLSIFSVNAIGTPSAKLSGGRGGKLEWKGKWDSAAKRTPDGYTVEMRIPWEMLNYPAGKKVATMGINFYRYQNHKKLDSIWSNVGQNSRIELEGQWTGVQPPHAAFKPKLSLLPYVLPGWKTDRGTFRAGIDARETLTPDLTAVGSLNPDFATIEGAVEGIAFSRQERFIPERRPFFLEGQDFFNVQTRFNDIGAFFYSRRIPTFDLGTKVYGKISPVDTIGVLNATEFNRRSDTVVRFRHSINDTSSAGFFLSNKAALNDENTVAAVDQHARFGPYSLETVWAKSMGPNAGGSAIVVSGNYQKRNNTTLLQYDMISSRFRVPDGYIPYKNYHGFFGFTDYNGQWRNGEFRSYDYGVYGLVWDRFNGAHYQQSAGSFASLVTKSDWGFTFAHDYAVVEGQMDHTVTLGVTSGFSNRFRRFGLNVQTGILGGQKATFLAPTASLRLLKHMDISYGGSILNLQGVTKQHILTANYELSPTRSFGGRLVAQDSDTNWYLSYRSAGGKGTDLYFIIGDPNARRFTRQVQLKLVFAY